MKVSFSAISYFAAVCSLYSHTLLLYAHYINSVHFCCLVLVHDNDSCVHKCIFGLLVYSVCFSLQLNHSRYQQYFLYVCNSRETPRGQQLPSISLRVYSDICTLRVFFVLVGCGCLTLKVWLKVQLLISLLALSVFYQGFGTSAAASSLRCTGKRPSFPDIVTTT
jgi:hypothetical protein